jgi:pimeloyl-ACP methyl ester carboxylesterase
MERRSIDIGGVALDAVVAGSGPVTVVFENGLASVFEEWDVVAPRVAARTRTLRYDRRRAPLKGRLPRRSVLDMVAELERLLEALTLSPPYVLVGHSWGGVVARLFAHAHPSEVAGLVFVDVTHEDVDQGYALLPALYKLAGIAMRAKGVQRWFVQQSCPPGSSPAYRARFEREFADPVQRAILNRTARAEGGAVRASLAEVRRTCSNLPPVPVHVLTQGAVSGPNVKVHDAWKATVARAAAARYTNIPTSGHYINIEAPDAVTDAINGVLDAVDAKRATSD